MAIKIAMAVSSLLRIMLLQQIIKRNLMFNAEKNLNLPFRWVDNFRLLWAGDVVFLRMQANLQKL